MKLSEELEWRGFIHQTTLKDITELDKKHFTFYWGVDPSAPSMTIGNLAAAMMALHFLKHGHKAFLLVGGATGMIGDPDGKTQERDLKSVEEIEENKKGLKTQYEIVFNGQPFEVVDNYEWFKEKGYIEFLRDVGKHVPMRQMLGRDFVQTRLSEHGAGISYAEFSYVLIQAYDFLHLHKEKDVNLQLCGSDQWGNSIAGVDLIRRITGEEAYVLSTPLIVDNRTGKKFGKTEEGAIWLEAKLTTIFKFYQFWLNVDDGAVIDYLKIYTLLEKEEIENIKAKFNKDRAGRLPQKSLAYEVTKLVHGKDQADKIVHITDVLFGLVQFEELNHSEVAVLREELPVVKASEDLYQMMVEAGLAASKSEARNFHAAGAISVNGHKTMPDQEIVFRSGANLLKRGKNSFALVEKQV